MGDGLPDQVGASQVAGLPGALAGEESVEVVQEHLESAPEQLLAPAPSATAPEPDDTVGVEPEEAEQECLAGRDAEEEARPEVPHW